MEDRPHNLWSDLATAALMGTERRAFALPDVAGPLGEMVRGMAEVEGAPESRLLAAAALVSTYRRAGTRAIVDPGELPPPCPDDDRPPTSDRSGGHLRAMLDGPYGAALDEWLAAAGAAGRRIRNRDLVDLLEHGRDHWHRREAIVAVIGGRGRWLASQNPAWSFAAPAELPEVDWQTATRDRRIARLRQLRASRPAEARELVASTWSQETPDDRAAFLSEFEVGLSMEDEPFLEAALDDSRAEVRHVAAALLVEIPGSRLRLRMIERVAPLLRIVERDGKPVVDVTLPEAYTRDMARDGITRTQPGMGERNAWLFQIICVVPLSYWTEATGRSPDELLRIIHRSEWELLLSCAWSGAAQRHLDQSWLEAIVEWDTELDSTTSLAPVVSRLDRDRSDRLLTAILSSGRPLSGNYLHLIADVLPAPWSLAFGRELIDRIVLRLQSTDRLSDPLLPPILRTAGYKAPTSMLEELTGLFPLDDPSVPPFLLRPIHEFLDAVRFRHQALTELSS